MVPQNHHELFNAAPPIAAFGYDDPSDDDDDAQSLGPATPSASQRDPFEDDFGAVVHAAPAPAPKAAAAKKPAAKKPVAAADDDDILPAAAPAPKAAAAATPAPALATPKKAAAPRGKKAAAPAPAADGMDVVAAAPKGKKAAAAAPATAQATPTPKPKKTAAAPKGKKAAAAAPEVEVEAEAEADAPVKPARKRAPPKAKTAAAEEADAEPAATTTTTKAPAKARKPAGKKAAAAATTTAAAPSKKRKAGGGGGGGGGGGEEEAEEEADADGDGDGDAAPKTHKTHKRRRQATGVRVLAKTLKLQAEVGKEFSRGAARRAGAAAGAVPKRGRGYTIQRAAIKKVTTEAVKDEIARMRDDGEELAFNKFCIAARTHTYNTAVLLRYMTEIANNSILQAQTGAHTTILEDDVERALLMHKYPGETLKMTPSEANTFNKTSHTRLKHRPDLQAIEDFVSKASAADASDAEGDDADAASDAEAAGSDAYSESESEDEAVAV